VAARQAKADPHATSEERSLISAKELALGLGQKAWRTIQWREGSAAWLSSRFARVRVCVGHRHQSGDI
jgi:hypothetical protein